MELSRVIQTVKISLQDPNNQNYTNDLLIEGVWNAVQAYAYYRGVSRRIGEGKLVVPSPAGSNSISVIGGLYSAGDLLTVNPIGSTPETLTVAAVEKAPPTGFTTNLVDTVTFTTNLQYNHPSQALVVPQNFGVKLTPGNSYFALPRDFIKFDKKSLDDALGKQTTSEKGIGFYDSVYTVTEAYSWIGWGYSTGFGNIWSGGIYPIVGNPAYNPNGGASSNTMNQATTLTVSRTDRPFLRLNPPASMTSYIDAMYTSVPTLDDISDSELIGIVSYIRYFALSSRAAMIGAQLDFSEADVSEHPSSTAQMLLIQAKEALEQFHRHFRMRPFVTSG